MCFGMLVRILRIIHAVLTRRPRRHGSSPPWELILPFFGKEEKDDADLQRLAGEKGLFEMMAEYNIETFNKYEWKELVVTGPHELNAFKNVYPKYGFERPVRSLHYFPRPLS